MKIYMFTTNITIIYGFLFLISRSNINYYELAFSSFETIDTYDDNDNDKTNTK